MLVKYMLCLFKDLISKPYHFIYKVSKYQKRSKRAVFKQQDQKVLAQLQLEAQSPKHP